MEDEVQTLQMGLNISSLSLLLLPLTLTSITWLQIFLATGADLQELSLTGIQSLAVSGWFCQHNVCLTPLPLPLYPFSSLPPQSSLSQSPSLSSSSWLFSPLPPSKKVPHKVSGWILPNSFYLVTPLFKGLWVLHQLLVASKSSIHIVSFLIALVTWFSNTPYSFPRMLTLAPRLFMSTLIFKYTHP